LAENTLTKGDFVDAVAQESGLDKKQASAAVDAVIQVISDSLKDGRTVSFTGFGKFHVAERSEREGRNPRTGESMTIAASKVPRFTAGSGLKKAIQD
jgi:nucleoid DNA-binding protein